MSKVLHTNVANNATYTCSINATGDLGECAGGAFGSSPAERAPGPGERAPADLRARASGKRRQRPHNNIVSDGKRVAG
jgi:hypothetical protein